MGFIRITTRINKEYLRVSDFFVRTVGGLGIRDSRMKALLEGARGFCKGSGILIYSQGAPVRNLHGSLHKQF